MQSKKESPLKRVWNIARSQHFKLKQSVVLALLGVTCGFIPYFCAGKLIILLLGKTAALEACLPYLLLALITSIAKVLFASYSTAISHKATFAVLAEIRQRSIRKLVNLSMGDLQAKLVENVLETIQGMPIVKSFNLTRIDNKK